MMTAPIVIDFETYYDKEYSLSKMTTEAYVRDERFETILCGVKIGKQPAYFVDVPDVQKHLDSLDLENHPVVAHHAHFDGLILNHHYGIRPKFWIDTLSMARLVHGAKGGNSLSKLAAKHNLPSKGNEVVLALGKRRADFMRSEFEAYGRYCANDCEIEYALAKIFLSKVTCRDELVLIDRTIRMFTEPCLQLNTDKLQTYIEDMNAHRVELLLAAGVTVGELTSQQKFAEALERLGVEPPLKMSPRTGRATYAFAKTDQAMQELAEHPDEAVQALIAARLNARSTINQTRAQRMIEMQGRGPACIYINHAGAGQTMRASGGDKMNWQNLTRGGMLREAVEAPDGFVLVVGDSANIESRQLDWLAGQEDQVEAYRMYDAGKGPDIYCVMAEKIFSKEISKKANPDERQLGKIAKLGLGYGMGSDKFALTVRQQTKGKTLLSPEMAENVVSIYRRTHHQVMALHNRCQQALSLIAEGKEGKNVDYQGIVKTHKEGLLLPNGLIIKYPDLEYKNYEWSYWDGRARVKIYGGKVCENIIQALARIIVMYQIIKVPHRLVLPVHDEGVWRVRKEKAELAKLDVEAALRTPLPWCESLPLNCEVGYHQSYGRAKQ